MQRAGMLSGAEDLHGFRVAAVNRTLLITAREKHDDSMDGPEDLERRPMPRRIHGDLA